MHSKFVKRRILELHKIMDELLTAEELAKQFKVRKNTLYVWVTRREIPFVKLPGDVTRFPRIAVETWLRKRSGKGKMLSKGIYLEHGDEIKG